MMYKFDTQTERASELDLTEKSKWFQHCKAAGLGNMHSSTIATILKQVETNLNFSVTTGESAAATTTEATEATEEKPKTTKAKKTTAVAAKGPGVAVTEVCDKYVEQTKFFEDAVVREQVF